MDFGPQRPANFRVFGWSELFRKNDRNNLKKTVPKNSCKEHAISIDKLQIANPKRIESSSSQIFQIWGLPHCAASRCKTAGSNWNSCYHGKAEIVWMNQTKTNIHSKDSSHHLHYGRLVFLFCPAVVSDHFISAKLLSWFSLGWATISRRASTSCPMTSQREVNYTRWMPMWHQRMRNIIPCWILKRFEASHTWKWLEMLKHARTCSKMLQNTRSGLKLRVWHTWPSRELYLLLIPNMYAVCMYIYITIYDEKISHPSTDYCLGLTTPAQLTPAKSGRFRASPSAHWQWALESGQTWSSKSSWPNWPNSSAPTHIEPCAESFGVRSPRMLGRRFHSPVAEALDQLREARCPHKKEGTFFLPTILDHAIQTSSFLIH